MWKKLSDEARRNIDENRTFALMVETPGLIKRLSFSCAAELK